MSIYATNSATDYPVIESGTYLARCVSMVQIGTVPVEFKGETKMQNKVRITWELPTETNEDLKPVTISKRYTLSMFSKSNLCKDLEGWRGKVFTDEEAKHFDITVLLGKTCQLSIIHQPKKDGTGEYAMINSIVSVPKGTNVPEQITPSFEFTYQDFDEDKYSSLPDFLKAEMKQSEEYEAHYEPRNTELNSEPATPEDDLPF